MTEQEIEAMLQKMKEERRTIWISRYSVGDGMARMTINKGRDGIHLVSDEFAKEMFKNYVFNPNNQ